MFLLTRNNAGLIVDKPYRIILKTYVKSHLKSYFLNFKEIPVYQSRGASFYFGYLLVSGSARHHHLILRSYLNSCTFKQLY